MQELIERAAVLAEALPFIQRFRGASFVIKYGGSAMQSAELSQSFAQDVVLLELVGINPVVVHGGGPQISELAEKLGLKSRFVRGMRVTDGPTMEAAEMVLQRLNKEVVAAISRQGGRAVGLSGKDGNLIVSRKMRVVVRDGRGKRSPVDVGQVGDVAEVHPELLRTLEENQFIPVVAPIGLGLDGLTYNINADVAAARIAAALKAQKLILLTDVEGVMDERGKLISTLSGSAARAMIARGQIRDGMVPKVECCLDALKAGVAKTHILDGRIKHVVLLEIFTRAGVGTEVVQASGKLTDLSAGASISRPGKSAP
jgi:acetylglutamate kinase